MSNVKDFLKRKDIVITPQRYLIEALGAMAQGLFASLLIGTITEVLPESHGISTYAKVKPAAQLDSLKKVYIIKSFDITE